MMDSIQVVINMKKHDNPCEIVLSLKDEFIEALGEQHRQRFNEYLIYAIFAEILAETGLKQTLELIEQLKYTTKDVHRKTLH